MSRRRKKSSSDEERAPAPKPLTDAVIRNIGAWADEACDGFGLVVFEVEIQHPWVIQIFVDRPDATPGKGVTIDECARVSRYVEALLDVDVSVWPNYTLEVSSPGIERKLTKPRHFELSIGRQVRVVVHQPIETRNVFEGVLVAFDENVASVECAADDVVAIEWSNIAKARLIHDFAE